MSITLHACILARDHEVLRAHGSTARMIAHLPMIAQSASVQKIGVYKRLMYIFAIFTAELNVIVCVSNAM